MPQSKNTEYHRPADVDAYLAKLSKGDSQVRQQLRETIKSIAPNIKECMPTIFRS